MEYKNFFIFDSLSFLIGFFIILFTLLIFIYSLGFIKNKKFTYYFWFFLTAFFSLGVVFSSHLLLIVIFWGFLGLTLFELINLYPDKDIADVAKKTFIIVGGSDSFLLFGFLLYSFLSVNNFIVGRPLLIGNFMSLLSFLFIVIACFAKAGCMPFHSWIPDAAERAPLPVAAYLPASLDKLLGIYLLVRIVKDTFILNDSARIILFILGSLTIIAAVMMAFIQHNIKRLLGYHAVSQVGYMVLGIATSIPLGIAAGLFHMLNNAIYKTCLFLGAGNVERATKTSELDDLGGLGKFMPITFISVLIASLSISGIPPFNGFVSKWLIYQSLIDFAKITSPQLKLVVYFSLVSALIGSSFTLASFLKLNGGVFFGAVKRNAKEVNVVFLFSPIILSLLCIIFGIFAPVTILKLISRSSGAFQIKGLWEAKLATLLIVCGIILGLLFFKIISKKIKFTNPFVGGLGISEKEEVEIVSFYNTVREIKIIKNIYNLAEKKFFDIYEQLKNFSFLIIKFLRYLHNGILPTYLVWCLIVGIGLFLIYFR